MKRILFYISIVIFLSCNQNKTTPKNVSVDINEEGIYFVEDSIEKINEQVNDSIISGENKEDEDCIFDQTTQTDEFLKGIKELDGYVWNQENRTATIKLSENETLEIFRGGCVHFGLSATFTFNGKNLYFDKDKDYIIKKSLWISKLLKEFAFKKISNSFNSNNYIVNNESQNSLFIYFLDEYLINNHYSIWVKDNSDYSKIIISFYIN